MIGLTRIKSIIKYLKEDMPLNNYFEDYDGYWENRGFNSPATHRGELISKKMLNNKRILDVGCGDGSLLKVLIKNNSPSLVKGVDVSQRAVDHVKKQGIAASRIDITAKEFELFLEKERFDYIIITEVLEHIQNPERVMETIKKLQPQAILFVSIPNAGFLLYRIRFLFGKFPLISIQEHIKEHIRFWTYSDFVYWTNYFGYKIMGLQVNSGTFINSIDLRVCFPSLLARQIIYELKLKEMIKNGI